MPRRDDANRDMHSLEVLWAVLTGLSTKRTFPTGNTQPSDCWSTSIKVAMLRSQL